MPNESEVLLLPGMRLTVQPGENPEEGLWIFDVSVSKDVAPTIDYPHPGCSDYDMVPDLVPSPLSHDGSEERRLSDLVPSPLSHDGSEERLQTGDESPEARLIADES